MSIYRVAICDDERTVGEEVGSLCRDILSEAKVEHEISLFSSAEELEKKLNEENCPFELLILDIQMNGMTGIELARRLRQKGNRISVIFVTACGEYLPEGYDVQPIHFLLKPIKRDALERAVLTDLRLNHFPKAAVLHIGSKTLNLTVSEILYIESLNHSVIIHRKSGSDSYYASLSEVEKALPSGIFSRCHKSYLVNLEYVQEIERTELTLQNGSKLPVGRAYYKDFSKQFIRFINN
ncbi:MAG: LytTR family DNA-binding domain-containing protein [Oscillospiraceae bacterium]|nr:LytTR family DNA-binding domain-containing protein [Oscillospiraceae bacterium]